MSINGEQIQKRILSDLKAVEDSSQILSSVTGRKSAGPADRGHDDRAAFCNMLSLLGIKDNRIAEEEEDAFVRFKEILDENGYTYTTVRLDKGWWKDSNGPILAVSEDGDLVPLKPKGFGYAFQDEYGNWTEKIKISNYSKFRESAFIFFRTLPRRSVTLKEYVGFTLKGMLNFRFWFMLLLCLAVSLLNTAIPLASKIVVDEVIPSGDTTRLIPVFIVLISVALSIGLFSAVRNLMVFGMKDAFSINAQAAMMHRALHLKSPFFKDYSAGNIATKVLSAQDAGDELSESLITTFFSIIVSIPVFVQIGIYTHFTIITWIVYMLLILECAAIYFGFRERLRIKLSKTTHKSIYNGIMSSFWQGIQKIKTNGAEVRFFRIWAKEYSQVEFMSWADTILLEMPPVINLLCLLAIVHFVPDSGIDTSDYVAFYSAFTIVTVALASMIPYAGNVTAFFSTISSVKPLLSAVPEVEDEAKTVRHLTGAVKVTGLKFRYDESQPYVVNGIDLDIKPGEYVAFVGRSGCGKSTLLRLMLGLETPESGSVFFDQYNVATVDKPSLRRKIGTCLQSGRLFAGTIRENISISNPNATDEDIWEAARIASIDEDIRKMPGGLDRSLDASGAGLSGGQRQRIMIARSVLNRPAVLVMDEATSALDNIAQSNVIRNLGQLHCTRIVIAHRLSTVRNCDRIIVLDKGEIAEQGTYDSLMAMKGQFYEIARRQQV